MTSFLWTFVNVSLMFIVPVLLIGVSYAAFTLAMRLIGRDDLD